MGLLLRAAALPSALAWEFERSERELPIGRVPRTGDSVVASARGVTDHEEQARCHSSRCIGRPGKERYADKKRLARAPTCGARLPRPARAVAR